MNAAVQPLANPLLDFSDLPRFGDIRPEHVGPAIDQLMAEAAAVVAQVTADDVPATWDAIVVPLDDATEKLSRAWGAVGHMNVVVDTPALRAAYNETLPRITEFWTGLSQNLALFQKYKQLRDSAEFHGLEGPRRRVIDNAIRDFRLGGAELSDADKERFAQIQERQAALAQKFSENMLDTTNAFALFVENDAELAGLPEDARQAAREAAEKEGKPGWKFTLHMPSYLPVLQYADNRALREKLYRAYVTRASEYGPPEWNNTGLIEDILALRREEAEILGFSSFAEVSLVAKMAESPAQVIDFLTDLARRTKPFAERDVKELKAFAAGELGLPELEIWDVAYTSEKLRQRRYAYSDQEVKQYFPEPKVLEGLFRVIENLFSVRVRPDVAPVWHPDARFFRIETTGGQLIGQFYLDLYARDGKRGGAWMDDARARRRLAAAGEERIQTPIAFLTCNFSSPVGGKPACFTHDDVLTLFHEFGHGLHHMLTQVDELGVNGLTGVEWDAVELPSQFMENFCWEWDVLRHMTAHVETGEALPRVLYDKMLAAKNFQAGMQFTRQIELALFDMRLHTDYVPGGPRSVQQVLDEVRAQVAVFVPPSFNRFQNSFSHVFAGGYAAGYYSYKWAEVLSADAYAYFEENAADGNVLNAHVGHRFLKEILEVGGSRPALESFVAFRGREPAIDALLRHNGMVLEQTP
jgi:oligopeptidase A